MKSLIHRNKLKIYGEHSKYINSLKFLGNRNLKNIKYEDSSRENTIEKTSKYGKTLSFNNNSSLLNYNIQNKNHRSSLKKKEIMNKLIINSINENVRTVSNDVLNNGNNINNLKQEIKVRTYNNFGKNKTISEKIYVKKKGISVENEKNNSNCLLYEKKYNLNVNQKKNEIKPKYIKQKTFSKPKTQVVTENNHLLNKENINSNVKTENEDNTTNKNKNIDKIEILSFEEKNIDNNTSTDSEENYFNINEIKNSPQIPKEYMNIIYKNLLIEENKGLNPKPLYNCLETQKEINEQMRGVLIDWIIDVHFKFNFMDETLYMTILIIDRYLSICQIKKITFQLLGITAMLIACKHEEIELPKVEDFIYITDNAYTKEEVFKMENDILNVFKFELLYPSPIKFFEYLSLKFNFNNVQNLTGKYLMETFLLDIKYLKYKPSVIACACAYIVMKFFKIKNYHEAYDKKYYNLNEKDSKFDEHDVKECAKDICYYVDNIGRTNFLSCKNKYSKDENGRVAFIVEGKK